MTSIPLSDSQRIAPPHLQPRGFVRILAASAGAGALVGVLLWLGDTASPIALVVERV